MTTISHPDTTDEDGSRIERAYSSGGIALIAISACVLGFLAATALTASGQGGVANAKTEAPLKGGRTLQTENDILQGIRSEISTVRQDNAALREEVAALTEQNGIIDKIIDHVRNLQGADREILALIKATDRAERPPEAEMEESRLSASPVKHEVVTPRAVRSPDQTPIPGKRPSEMNKGEHAQVKEGSPD